jgi:FOG: TPR repeat, SEL1 subfamily
MVVMRKIIATIIVAVMSAMALMAQTPAPDSLKQRKMLKAAYRYKHGINTDVNTVKAARIYKYLTNHGNAVAMRELGKMYLSGEGVRRSSKKAFALFHRAVAGGDAKALCQLGEMYREGNGIKVNFKRAFACYNAAAKRGEPQGYYGAGYLLYKGFGVGQNYKKAEKYLLKGSEKKHPGCDFLLGSYYASDISGTPDYEKAKHHYARAVKSGHGWTVDLTKFGTLDSIKQRNSMRGKLAAGQRWKNKLKKKHDTPETRLDNVSIDSLAGTWHGKAFTYDWSHSAVIDEEDITMVVENEGFAPTFRFMRNGETLSVFSPTVDDESVQKDTTKHEGHENFKWLTKKAKFGTADGKLCIRLVRHSMKRKELKKPMFLVLQREGQGSMTQNQLRIVDISPSPLRGSSFSVKVDSDVDCTAEVSIFSTTGLKVAECGVHSLSKGTNELRLNANLSNGHFVLRIKSKDSYATKNIIHL